MTQFNLLRLIAGEDYAWHTEGAQNNPGISTVLATTAALATVGQYMAYVLISSDAIAAINTQHRNAADTGNVTATNKQGEQRVYTAANNDREMLVFFRTTAANERLRVIPNAAVTGNVSASIWWRLIDRD